MRHTPLVHTTGPAGGRRQDWWRGAVIYQVYPRSFADSNGDGIGDIPGIISKLDYIAELGVDALWLSPFFKSPQKDYGYDVSDYRAVDQQFGSVGDIERLLKEAHARGLKVLFDFVPSHTSDEHPWFKESRSSRDNAKADWYIWGDARSDGSPPNNWLSVFGGPAWTWDSRRRQYYLHHFLKEQPAVNCWNDGLVEALMGEMRFWLELGVDGYRVDAVDWALADPMLRSNPARRGIGGRIGGTAPGSPFAMQYHIHDQAHPELGERLLKPMWRMSDAFEGATLLGEISGDTALIRAGEYSRGGGLDMVYTFDLLSCPFTAEGITQVIGRLEAQIGDGWMCWSFGNHDVARPVTRFGGENPPEELRRLIPVLLTTLKGTVCLYQGEELGLEEAELAYEDLKDPFGLVFWPDFKGRDGCRTPMPWQSDALNAGFSATRPWLPVSPGHLGRAVDRQVGDPHSTLHHTRRFLAWRKEQSPLRGGSIRFRTRRGPVLAFERTLANEQLLAIFNLTAAPAVYTAPYAVEPAGFDTPGNAYRNRRVELPAYGIAFMRPRA